MKIFPPLELSTTFKALKGVHSARFMEHEGQPYIEVEVDEYHAPLPDTFMGFPIHAVARIQLIVME